MNANNETAMPAIRAAQAADLTAIVSLLGVSGLPSGDLVDRLPGFFYVAEDGGALAGSVGVELHGRLGLLRSLAVAPRWRGCGLAAQLVERCEREARQSGVKELYLLTTSAADYFLRRGYATVERDQVPAAIAEHAQFRSLCPASAKCLRLTLIGREGEAMKLDQRTHELIAIGAAISLNCQPCLEYHVAQARDCGLGNDEILAAIEVGKQVRRGASAKMDRFAAQHVLGSAAQVAAAGCECASA